jgi:hypothetical protein
LFFQFDFLRYRQSIAACSFRGFICQCLRPLNSLFGNHIDSDTSPKREADTGYFSTGEHPRPAARHGKRLGFGHLTASTAHHCEAVPSEYDAADMVFLGTGFAALAFLYAEHLFTFAVVLFDFPASATDRLDVNGRIYGIIVGGNS